MPCCKSGNVVPCCNAEKITYRANIVPNCCSVCTIKTVSSFDAPCPEKETDELIIKGKVIGIIKAKYGDIEQACQIIDNRHTNKVLRHQLKQVLRLYCFPLTTKQFDAVVPHCLTDPCGRVCYKAFLEDITCGIANKEPFVKGAKEYIPRSVTLDELNMMLRYKVEKNLKNVCRGIMLYDYAQDGYIQKKELRKVLENYCFKFTDDQYDLFWHQHDPLGVGIVCYEDLLFKLGVNVGDLLKRMPHEVAVRSLCWTDEAVKNCKEKLKFKQMRRYAEMEHYIDPCVRGMAINDVIKIFLRKLACEGMDRVIINSCHLFDPKNTGYILTKELHSVFNHFVMPMPYSLFLQIMDSCLPRGVVQKKVCWRSFVNKYCNGKALECIPYYTHMNPIHANAMKVIDKIKMNVLNPKDRLADALQTYSHQGHKVFIRKELKRVLTQMNFKLTQTEYADLFALINPTHDNYVHVKDFLGLFDYPVTKPCDVDPPGSVQNKINRCNLPNYRDPERCAEKAESFISCVSNSNPNPLERGPKKVIEPHGYPTLIEGKLKRKLKLAIVRNKEVIQKSMEAIDMDKSGKIHLLLMRKILENYCFALTNPQWESIISDFESSRDEIYYNIFLDSYKKDPTENIDRYLKSVTKLMHQKHKNLDKLGREEVIDIVKDFVKSKRNALLKDFALIDYSNLGTVAKEDFRLLINKHMFRMNQQQFECFWIDMPKSERGRFKYLEFLQDYGCIPTENLPYQDPPLFIPCCEDPKLCACKVNC